VVADQTERRITAMIHLHVDTQVVRHDRLVMGDDVFEVQVVLPPPSKAIYRRAEGSTVQEGRL
jgi:hypothetical protein